MDWWLVKPHLHFSSLVKSTLKEGVDFLYPSSSFSSAVILGSCTKQAEGQRGNWSAIITIGETCDRVSNSVLVRVRIISWARKARCEAIVDEMPTA